MDFDGKLVKLKPEKFEISTDRGQTVKAKREQYPLKVAYRRCPVKTSYLLNFHKLIF